MRWRNQIMEGWGLHWPPRTDGPYANGLMKRNPGPTLESSRTEYICMSADGLNTHTHYAGCHVRVAVLRLPSVLYTYENMMV